MIKKKEREGKCRQGTQRKTLWGIQWCKAAALGFTEWKNTKILSAKGRDSCAILNIGDTEIRLNALEQKSFCHAFTACKQLRTWTEFGASVLQRPAAKWSSCDRCKRELQRAVRHSTENGQKRIWSPSVQLIDTSQRHREPPWGCSTEQKV